MQTLLELRTRINKAEQFFADPNISKDKKEEYFESYRRLIQQVSLLSSVYISESLKLKFWWIEDGTIKFEDGVEYDQDEQAYLLSLNNPLIKGIHELKKTFDGKLTDIRDHENKEQLKLIS